MKPDYATVTKTVKLMRELGYSNEYIAKVLDHYTRPEPKSPSFSVRKGVYRNLWVILMFTTEGLACISLTMMMIWKNHLNALMTCGFLAIIFTIITMSMHILVRMEELKWKHLNVRTAVFGSMKRNSVPIMVLATKTLNHAIWGKKETKMKWNWYMIITKDDVRIKVVPDRRNKYGSIYC